MATLDPGNIVNGNTIQPNDLLQLYQAFGTGSGASITGLAMTGSLNGTATTATNASKLDPTLNASTNQNYNVLFATTSSATYETIYKENGDIMTYNPSTNVLTVTSSYATTASYALVAENAGTPTQIDSQYYERLGSSVNTGTFKFVAGAVALSSGTGTSDSFPTLAGKTLGIDAFIVANMNVAGVDIVVTGINGSGAISFTSTGGSGNDTVYFTGIAVF